MSVVYLLLTFVFLMLTLNSIATGDYQHLAFDALAMVGSGFVWYFATSKALGD